MPSLIRLAIAQHCRWHAFPNAHVLEEQAVSLILSSAVQAITERGAFLLVLAGGTTPKRIYERLSQCDAAWDKWQIYFGDERCLPPEHPERNSLMAKQAWLDRVPIPLVNQHPIPAELGPQQGSTDYSRFVRDIDLFDLVLLGLGEDGHTASLFPEHDWGAREDAPPMLAVFDAPKPPPARISMSATRLSRARQVVFLVTGQAKRQAVQRWKHGAALPAASIVPSAGADVFLEESLLEAE